MHPKQVLSLLNKTTKPEPAMADALQRRRDVYYGMSLHTTGACPRFRDAVSGRMVTPAGYFGEAYQYLFDNYLLSRHPRESDATRAWRYSQYRPLTKAPFAQLAEVVTGAIFQDANYTLELQDAEDTAYIWGNNFAGHNIAGYFAQVGFKHVVEDPNGLFVRMPAQPYYEQPGEGRVAVGLRFVHSKDIIHHTPQCLVFADGAYAYSIDAHTIWRYTYRADKKDYIITPADAKGYYTHLLGRLPVSVAGGEWNTQGYYDSYFSKAKAAADDFVSAYSAAQLVDKEASHPFIVEAATDCPDCHGRGQLQRDCETCPMGIELVDCYTCGGQGQVSRNPGQRIVIPQDKLKDGDPIQIINPDVSINTHHRTVCNSIMQLILEALHLRVVDEAQSGLAKAIDQERLYKFISKISNDIFDRLIADSLTDILAYRHATSADGLVQPLAQPFKIVKPTQFSIKTAADLLAEYNEGTRANMPVFIRRRMAMDFVDKQYSGDDLMKRKAQLITTLDPLSLMHPDELKQLLDAGIITKADMAYSHHLPAALDALVVEKGENWLMKTANAAIAAAITQA